MVRDSGFEAPDTHRFVDSFRRFGGAAVDGAGRSVDHIGIIGARNVSAIPEGRCFQFFRGWTAGCAVIQEFQSQVVPGVRENESQVVPAV
ncbi:hypothetical protein, partial [Sphaerisporangium rufum]|uniref:hypothetical protein n=1 Tax=Sphaerisporangium rufum TaxID=1381558 RepID=UPI001951E104